MLPKHCLAQVQLPDRAKAELTVRTTVSLSRFW